jgi:hypothetical protein
MNPKGKILIVASSIDTFELKTGHASAAGGWWCCRHSHANRAPPRRAKERRAKERAALSRPIYCPGNLTELQVLRFTAASLPRSVWTS